LLYGDAIGNHIVEMRKLLLSWGYQSSIFAPHLDPRYGSICQDYHHYEPHAENMVLLHHAVASDMVEFARGLPDQVVPYYHNITPAHFYQGTNSELAKELSRGRAQLRSLRELPFAIAASDYNRQEMLATGFKNVAVVPYILDLARLDASARSEAGVAIREEYDDGGTNILFVGRIVPHKRQEDLIRTFEYYHRLVNPQSRLLLVGSGAEFYQAQLGALVEMLGLEESVHFCGHVGPEEGLGAYYEIASVFLSMSEHEGFCVPLVESAYFDVPIIAYKAAGVPYTLGDSGILITEKRYEVIAELIDLLSADPDLRRDVIASQHRLLDRFSPDTNAALLRQAISEAMSMQ
jgi:glycosyltransferase involved in cell wall biosynthesis